MLSPHLNLILIEVSIFCPQEEPESSKYESDEEEKRDKQETVRESYEGADRITVEMMDSTDDPVQRSVLL